MPRLKDPALRALSKVTARKLCSGFSTGRINGRCSVSVRFSALLVPLRLEKCIRPGTGKATIEAAITSWYRQLLKAEVPPLIEAWEPSLNVAVSGFYVQRMKTKFPNREDSGCDAGRVEPTFSTVGSTRRNSLALAKEYLLLHQNLRFPKLWERRMRGDGAGLDGGDGGAAEDNAEVAVLL